MENREGTPPDPVTPPPLPPDAVRAGAAPAGPAFRDGPPGPDGPVDEALTAGQRVTQWLMLNGFSLVVVLGVVGLILYKFTFDEQLAIGKAALGLSFVIFIHELGHFLVAKWCDVHVTTFSIGFGPAIPGCSYQWGETTYKLSLFPLGGYVQMVGQVDGDEASDGSEEDPRSYRNKTVGQRMAIISAGVIMNVILAIVCFVVVFQGPGKDRPAAVVGAIDTDSPAFRQGVRTAAEIVQIGDIKNPNFEELMITVMSSVDGEKIPFVEQRPGDTPVTLEIEPRLNKADPRPVIGVSPAPALTLRSRRYFDASFAAPVIPGSAAAQANPPFAFGDRIVATTDPDHPDQVTDLPDDPRAPGLGQKDYFAFARRLQQLAGQEVTVVVERGQGESPERVAIRVPPAFAHTLGVRMQMGKVVSIRHGSPADGKVHGPDPAKSRYGDQIEVVQVKDAAGTDVIYSEKEKTLDPERLPTQLKRWAADLARAGVKGPWPVTLQVRRHQEGAGPQFKDDVTVTLNWDDGWRFDKAIPMNSLTSPLAIPELGLAYSIETMVAVVTDPASPLKVGDVVTNIKYNALGADGAEVKGSWQKEDLEPGTWARVSHGILQSTDQVTKVFLKVNRDKAVVEVEVTPAEDRTWPLTDRGWVLMQDMRRQKAGNIFEAVALGLKDTHNSMMQVFQNLRGMATGRLSVKNLGGPLTIANVAYRFAGLDFWEFVFFLGLISVNLAVVNFLPIPVLDGGHMVFLVYEKLRGQPASEAVRVGATYAGLALILCLMMFVLYLDISRLFL